jgi:diguanylate cyclase (GGDEF)-like protein
MSLQSRILILVVVLLLVLLGGVLSSVFGLSELGKGLVAIGITAGLVALAGAFRESTETTEQIRSLENAARRIAAGDYGAELPTGKRGELMSLAQEIEALQREVQFREEAFNHLAFYDDLTGLPNRNQFRIDLCDQIEEAGTGGRRLAIGMVDFDRFKGINDTLGHHFGERLLSEIADRLSITADRLGIKVARLGGDEFGLLLSAENVVEARETIERLHSLLGTSIEIDDLRIDIQANTGLTVYPDQGGDAETLLQQAEVAMYVAKARRLKTTFYEASQNGHSVHRIGLMSDLRKAVENDELDLRFQPKLDLANGRVDQAEVFLRWTHATQGEIGPAEFIPIAEQTGFIRDITAWVMKRSLEQVGLWLHHGLDVSAAVNVSALDLHDRTLPARLQQMLDASGVSPDHLVLEVTESTVMTDFETGQRVLEELDGMGIAISIDDFGTGYSSLAQLRRLPVRELKIDRSFISQMGTIREVEHIVRSTIELGHNLGLRVVAEGVESSDTMESLREMGCDLVQGFFISKPLTAMQLEKWRNRVRSARATG